MYTYTYTYIYTYIHLKNLYRMLTQLLLNWSCTYMYTANRTFILHVYIYIYIYIYIHTFEKSLSDADTIITLTSGVSFVIKVSFIVVQVVDCPKILSAGCWQKSYFDFEREFCSESQVNCSYASSKWSSEQTFENFCVPNADRIASMTSGVSFVVAWCSSSSSSTGREILKSQLTTRNETFRRSPCR